MGTVPNPVTWTNLEIPNFRDLNSRIYDVLNFLMNPPMIRLRKTVTQNIATSTDTALIWDFVETETENMWDATLPTRIKPKTPGWYIGSTGVSFAADTNGYRQLIIRKNNSSTVRTLVIKSDGFTQGGATTSMRGNSFIEQFNGTTDYVETVAWQTSGSTLAVQVAGLDGQPDFSLKWFAPL